MLMRGLLGSFALMMLCVTGASAQEAKPDQEGPRTLTGCVSGAPITSGEFTFTERDSGGRYRLTGKSVRKFAGQRVEIVGGPRGRRLSIRGGLWPSPNVAAQAGAMDPAQAAIASQPGNAGTAAANLPEFNVVRVKGVDGVCE